MMKIGFYAGSFDPFTNGHLHVLTESLKIFDKVIIGIGVNSDKQGRRFDADKMVKAIEQMLINQHLNNVSVIAYEGFTVDAAKEQNATVLIRGLRNGMDYENEEKMAAINEEISGLNTIYIRAGNLGNISSSLVMSMIQHNKDISKYVPKEILDALLSNS